MRVKPRSSASAVKDQAIAPDKSLHVIKAISIFAGKVKHISIMVRLLGIGLM